MLCMKWSRSSDQMTVSCGPYTWYMDVHCEVRNDMQGWRKDKVVHAITEDNKATDIPVRPMPFPIGHWNVIDMVKRTQPDRAPIMIVTNAHQLLDIWELDDEGNYLRKTGKQIMDWQYNIHCSCFTTSLGCLVAGDLQQLKRLGAQTKLAFSQHYFPNMEVTA